MFGILILINFYMSLRFITTGHKLDSVQVFSKNSLDFYEPIKGVQISDHYKIDKIVLDAKHTPLKESGFNSFISIQNKFKDLKYDEIRKDNILVPLAQSYETTLTLFQDFFEEFQERYVRYENFNNDNLFGEKNIFSFEYFGVADMVVGVLTLEDLLQNCPDKNKVDLTDDVSAETMSAKSTLVDMNLVLQNMLLRLEQEYRILDSMSEGSMDIVIESFLIDQIEKDDTSTYKIGEFWCTNVQLGPVCTVEIVQLRDVDTWYKLEGIPLLGHKLDDTNLYSRNADVYSLDILNCERISDGILYQCSHQYDNNECEKSLNEKKVKSILNYCSFVQIQEDKDIISTLSWVIYVYANLLSVDNYTDLPVTPFNVIGIQNNEPLSISYSNRDFIQQSNSQQMIFSGFYFSDSDVEEITQYFETPFPSTNMFGIVQIILGAGFIIMSVLVCLYVTQFKPKQPNIIFRVNGFNRNAPSRLNEHRLSNTNKRI